jgi:hypothetical protein
VLLLDAPVLVTMATVKSFHGIVSFRLEVLRVGVVVVSIIAD